MRGSSTTSAWGRSTRPRPSRGARPSAWSSSATPPSMPRCRSSRSAGSTPRTRERRSTPGRSGYACCERSPRPRTRPRQRAAYASCSTRTPWRAELASSNRPERGQREELLRDALEPLGEDERPPALLVAVAVCALLALAVILGVATVHDLSRHGGSLPGGVFLAVVLLLLALGMYQRRYWAVLGFEALLAFQILVTSLALVIATTILAAALCLLSIGLGGWLFWKLVRVMGRMQAGQRAPPPHQEHTLRQQRTA